MYQLVATHQSACVVEPGVVVVEVSFGGVVGLVGDLVQLEHEGEVSHPPHLHLWRLGRVSVNSEEHHQQLNRIDLFTPVTNVTIFRAV